MPCAQSGTTGCSCVIPQRSTNPARSDPVPAALEMHYDCSTLSPSSSVRLDESSDKCSIIDLNSTATYEAFMPGVVEKRTPMN